MPTGLDIEVVISLVVTPDDGKESDNGPAIGGDVEIIVGGAIDPGLEYESILLLLSALKVSDELALWKAIVDGEGPVVRIEFADEDGGTDLAKVLRFIELGTASAGSVVLVG